MKRIALITGAYRGLGLETARQLGTQGYKVILSSRDGAKAEAAAAKLREADIDAEAVALDVNADSSVNKAAAEIQRKHLHLDVLINNAGVFHAAPSPSALSNSTETLLADFNTNTVGAFRAIRAFTPLMQKNRYGRIVNVSSGMGQLSEMEGGYPGYRMSKTAMNALTRLLAGELKHQGILINAVCPGWVRTEMGGESAPRSVDQGASGIVWAATLPNEGPTGGYFRDGKPLAW